MMMSEARKPEKATPLQVAQAVFWSFLGIRKRAALDRDAVSLTPLQVIVAGIIGAVVVVVSLVLLVRLIAS